MKIIQKSNVIEAPLVKLRVRPAGSRRRLKDVPRASVAEDSSPPWAVQLVERLAALPLHIVADASRYSAAKHPVESSDDRGTLHP